MPLIQKNVNPAFSNSALNTSLNLQRLNFWLAEIVFALRSTLKVKREKSISIPLQIFEETNKFLISYTLKEIIDENFSVKIESNDLKKIFLLVKKQSGKSEELSENLIVVKERKEITIRRKLILRNFNEQMINVGNRLKIDGKVLSITEVKKSKIKIGKSKNVEFISGDNLSDEFIVRAWKEGDKFFPIGMQGSKKISDYLNDIKINSFEKKKQLVLENMGKIVWVIGRRLDDRFKLTSETKKVIELCLK